MERLLYTSVPPMSKPRKPRGASHFAGQDSAAGRSPFGAAEAATGGMMRKE